MFVSFFPSPRLFFLSALVWAAVAIAIWYAAGVEIGEALGFKQPAEDAPPLIGIHRFWSPPFLFFYLYYGVALGLFATFWMLRAPHPWARWSILGSGLILFATYFQVQVSVAINDWFGPFYNTIQRALDQNDETPAVTLPEFFGNIVSFAEIATVAITVAVLIHFFSSHYTFRWRNAMNDYYLENWGRLRNIEGASQRIQDDTMRFAGIAESLGVRFVDSIMTLIAFLPVLVGLSEHITELPIIGVIPYPLVTAAIAWSVFGTGFVALIGIRLPGLEFKNQRVEAAFRKELVYGEDDHDRAQPLAMTELFGYVRNNYFKLYFNYMYFNVGRYLYLQTDTIYGYIILAPTIVAGNITLGIMQQVLRAFGQVADSFQFLINSWTRIVELMSIYKRLRAFEAVLSGEELGDIETSYRPPVLEPTAAE